jgi:gamma-glutamyltranspeptidase/glutathione hydrolase
MVAAKHPLIAQTGVEVMAKGGNAVDAAVAAAFVDCVVEPAMNGLGGEGVMAIHLAETGEDVIIDFVGRPSGNCSPDMFELDPKRGRVGLFGWKAVKGDANIIGHKAATVPGEVAGLCLALERYGTMSLDEVMKPAIKIAEDGFPVSYIAHSHICQAMEVLSRFPEWTRIFLKERRFPPRPADLATRTPPDVLVQKNLAGSLRKIARDGRDAFYKGEIAEAIAQDMERHGGLIDEQDLADFDPIVTKPVPGSYRGCDVIFDPTHAGTTLVEILNILEGFDLKSLGHMTPRSIHIIADAIRLAFADRLTYLGDPGFVKVPTRGLVSKEYAEAQRRRIDPKRATSIEAGEPWAYEGDHTTHLSVVDEDRNMVSIGQTLVTVFGCGVVVPGTGMVLNSAMSGLNPEPGHANSIAPRKRRIQNVCPTLLLKNGKSLLNVGAPGGRAIPIAVAQVIVNIVDYGMGIQEAIEAPRITTEVEEVFVDNRVPRRVRDALRRMGHQVIEVDRETYNFARPVGVLVDQRRNVLHGGVDCLFTAFESQAIGY